MAQSAISSASSSTRWIDAMVASILTTTPFFSPREGCVPRPMMFKRFSFVTSATIATIFEVPMSRPTIMFLLSFTMLLHSLRRLFWRTFFEVRNARREAVPVTQVDVIDACASTSERSDGPAVIRDKTRQALARVGAPKLDRERGRPRGLQLPATTRRAPYAVEHQSRRLQRYAERMEMRGDLTSAAFGPVELGQLA